MSTLLNFVLDLQRCKGINLGKFQKQPTLRHLNRPPNNLLRRHATFHLLSVPTRVGSMESQAGGKRGVRLHPRDHSRRHRSTFCRRHSMGRHRCVCRRERCPILGHHPHIHTSRSDLEKAEVSRESINEEGDAVPSTSRSRRCISSDLEWFGKKATS